MSSSSSHRFPSAPLLPGFLGSSSMVDSPLHHCGPMIIMSHLLLHHPLRQTRIPIMLNPEQHALQSIPVSMRNLASGNLIAVLDQLHSLPHCRIRLLQALGPVFQRLCSTRSGIRQPIRTMKYTPRSGGNTHHSLRLIPLHPSFNPMYFHHHNGHRPLQSCLFRRPTRTNLQ